MPPDGAEFRAALASAATLGPFFTLQVRPDWAPLDDVALRAYAARTRTATEQRFGHPVEERVVGSLTHLALAAGLLSPALVTAAQAGLVPDLSRTTLRWRPDRDGPVPLALAEPRALTVAGDPAAAIAAAVLPTLQRIGAVLAPHLAAGLLSGNIASAVATAGRLAPVAAQVATAVLALPALREAGSPLPAGFRRRSCCLYYRLDPRAGLCEDCGLPR